MIYMMPSLNMDKLKEFILIWIEKLVMLKDMHSLNIKISNKPNKPLSKWINKKYIKRKSPWIGLLDKNLLKIIISYEKSVSKIIIINTKTQISTDDFDLFTLLFNLSFKNINFLSKINNKNLYNHFKFINKNL